MQLQLFMSSQRAQIFQGSFQMNNACHPCTQYMGILAYTHCSLQDCTRVPFKTPQGSSWVDTHSWRNLKVSWHVTIRFSVRSCALLRKMFTLSNFLSFVQISCAGSRIFSLCLLQLIIVHYYIETCQRAYIRTTLGTLPSNRGLGRRASGSVHTGVISSCRPSCPIHPFQGLQIFT